MQRVIWHPDRDPDVGPMEQRAVLAALNGQTSYLMRSVIFDANTLHVDLRVHAFNTVVGMGYALVAVGREKDETVIVSFDSMQEAVEKYMRVVERCERDPLCRLDGRQHAWDVTDHHLIPCNDAKAA